jgi:hypothetical protein
MESDQEYLLPSLHREGSPMMRTLPVFLVVLFGAGCISSGNGHGTLIARYEASEVPEVMKAPRENTYALYAGSTAQQGSGDGTLRAQVRVLCGCPIGFEKEENGQLTAVAGQRRIPLPEGLYWWEAVPDSTQATTGEWYAQARNQVGEKVEEAGKVIGVPVQAALYTAMLPVCLLLYGLGGGSPAMFP